MDTGAQKQDAAGGGSHPCSCLTALHVRNSVAAAKSFNLNICVFSCCAKLRGYVQMSRSPPPQRAKRREKCFLHLWLEQQDGADSAVLLLHYKGKQLITEDSSASLKQTGTTGYASGAKPAHRHAASLRRSERNKIEVEAVRAAGGRFTGQVLVSGCHPATVCQGTGWGLGGQGSKARGELASGSPLHEGGSHLAGVLEECLRARLAVVDGAALPAVQLIDAT